MKISQKVLGGGGLLFFDSHCRPKSKEYSCISKAVQLGRLVPLWESLEAHRVMFIVSITFTFYFDVMFD